jgi:hypothetical protein
MAEHRRTASRWRRLAVVTLSVAVLTGGGWVGVNALMRADTDRPAGRAQAPGSSATPSSPPSTSRSASPSTATPSKQPQRVRSAPAFPGQPKKRTGVTESGMASGLGDDAGDLAKRAQDLIDENDRTPAAPEPLRFVVSSFNVLGASHTARGGNKRGWATGEARLGRQIGMLDANDVDVVGFQEFEASQFRSFMRRTGGSWGVYPALSKGRNFVRNSIAWRQNVWNLADYQTVTIPYFRGEPIQMPIILLTHKETGRQSYFFNVHNPASNPRRGNNERWRDEATRREIAHVRRLKRNAPKVPVVLTGDFNEVGEAYCRITRDGDIKAANPGGDRPGCALPQYAGIDWIFGTSDIDFSDYVVQRTGGASDHPMLVATATVD